MLHDFHCQIHILKLPFYSNTIKMMTVLKIYHLKQIQMIFDIQYLKDIFKIVIINLVN